MTSRLNRPCYRSDCTNAEPHDHALTVEEAWRVIERMAGIPDDPVSEPGIERAADLDAANDGYADLALDLAMGPQRLDEREHFRGARCFLCRKVECRSDLHRRVLDEGRRRGGEA